MKLLKRSPNFTPLHQGLFFGIDTENSTPSDVMVEILDATTDEVIAVQQLRSIISAEVNVAPYLKRFSEYVPSSDMTGFKEAPTRACAIRVGNMVSEPLLISTNNSIVATPSAVTTFPDSRYLALEERDEVLLLVEENDNLVANIRTDSGDSLDLEYTTTAGAVVLTIYSMDFDTMYSSTIDVDIMCNDRHLISLHYSLTANHKESCRLAWISESGSIEKYTFPIVAKKEYKSNKLHIDGHDNRRIVCTTSESELALISRYEPRAIIEPLSQVISSPRVWIEQPDDIQEVVVTTSAVDSNIFGEPSYVRLLVSEMHKKEVAL